MAVPEIGREGAFDQEMVKLELDHGSIPREVAANVDGADDEAGDGATIAMGFDDHIDTLGNRRKKKKKRPGEMIPV